MGWGPEASAWGKGIPLRHPEPPDPLKLALVPGTCRSFRVLGLSLRPLRSSSGPQSIFHSPKSFSPHGSPGHPHTRVLSPRLPALCRSPAQSCTPLVFPSRRTQPLGPLRWAAGRLGWNPGRESSRLGGRPLVVAAAGRLPEPAAVRAPEAAAASGDPGFPGCASFGQAARRWRRGRSRPLRPGARSAGLGALPAWPAVLRICSGGGSASNAPSLKTPSAWQEPRVWLPLCRARWRGRERRGQCLHLVTKGSRCSSPPERPTALRPPSRHLVALARRAASLCCCAARRCLPAAGGTKRHRAVAGGRAAVSEGMR